MTNETLESIVVPGTIAGFPALRTRGRRGDRPTLLFLHGAFNTHEPFAPWVERLGAAGWDAVAASRRGRLGVGPARAKGLGIADYVDDTLRVIEALGEAPIVIGHSVGGLIAQKVAEAGACRGAVLLAPAPPAMLTAQAVALPAYLAMMPKILAGAPVLPACSACERIALNRVPEAERKGIHESLVHESGKVYREMIFGTIKVDAAKVRVPMLVVAGAADRIVSLALCRATAARYGAELKTYDDHAHWLVGEPGWTAIADDVAAWLGRSFAISGSGDRGSQRDKTARAG